MERAELPEPDPRLVVVIKNGSWFDDMLCLVVAALVLISVVLGLAG